MPFVRDFSRDRRNSGGRDFARRDFDKPQMMHKTICSNCGKECEVPFKPNGSKPVFCRECFQANRTGESTRPANDYQRRPNFEDRNNNFPPPPPSRPNFDGGPHQPPPPHKAEFEALNIKLDRILNMLSEVKSQEGQIIKEKIKKPAVVASVAAVEPAVVEPVTEVEPEPVVKIKKSTAKKASKKKLVK